MGVVLYYFLFFVVPVSGIGLEFTMPGPEGDLKYERTGVSLIREA